MSKKKNAIVQAATVLFANKGFRQTSMAELSKLTGVAEGTIFYHFKNKEEIFLSVLKSAKNRIEREIDSVNEPDIAVDGLEAVVQAVSVYLNLAGQMQDEFLMLHRYYPYEISTRNAECRTFLESIHNRFLNLFETALARGLADGSIHIRSPRKTAMILFAMADGIARLETYNIYHSGALYQEFIQMCRKMLTCTDDGRQDGNLSADSTHWH